MEHDEDDYDYYDEDEYKKMSQEQLLALAARDQLAAEEFYYRYHYSNDPVLEAEARKVLKSLAEDFEARGFWADWYNELLLSDDPKERDSAEAWRQKIIHKGVYGREELIAMHILDEDEEYVERIE